MTSDLSNKKTARGPVGQMPGRTDFQADLVAMPAKLCSLPPLNSIATRVLALSDDPDGDVRRLATLLEGDPAFAAEILFLANSPLFGFSSKLQVVSHAIAILGVDRIKALAATVAMRAFVSSGGPLIRQCWRHSAASAVIGERISPIFGAPGDHAYTAALIHDIGRLGLLKCYPQQMGPVLGGEHADLHEAIFAERASIKVDHQFAGAWLVKHWAMPEPLVEVCRHHHDPVREGDSPLLRVVKTSCRMADSLGYSAVVCRCATSYTDLVAEASPAFGKDRFPAEDELREQVEQRLTSFEQ